MRRRRFLVTSGAALGSALAGCMGDDENGGDDEDWDLPPIIIDDGSDDEGSDGNGEADDDSDDDEPSDDVVETVPTDEHDPLARSRSYDVFEDDGLGIRGALVGARTSPHDDLDVRREIHGHPTGDHPPILDVTVTNRGTSPLIIRRDEIAPFDVPRTTPFRSYADRGSRGLIVSPLSWFHLAATSASDFIASDPEIERDGDGAWEPAEDEPGESFPRHIRIEPRQTLYGEFVLLMGGEFDGIAPGRYTIGEYESDVAVTVWDRDHPGPLEESEFGSIQVPDLPERATDWYHEADARTECFLFPNREEVSIPAQVEFSLVNHSTEPLEGSRYDRSLWKLVDDEWFRIPRGIPLHRHDRLLPGESLTVEPKFLGGPGFDEGEQDIGPLYFGRQIAGIPHLGGGTYALAVDAAADGDTTAALIDLSGEPTTVVPTEDVSKVVDGDTLVLTDERWEETNPEDRRTVVMTVTDDPPAEADRRLIPEQVMQPWNDVLRNLLAHRDEAPVVQLRTDDFCTRNAIETDNGSEVLDFEGDRYRLDVDPTDE